MAIDIIIDTDPGCDDALAILWAVSNPEFVVHAITTVCGNDAVDVTTRNAQYLLGRLGRTDIPVYSGAEKPLKRPLERAVVHGESGLGEVIPTNAPQLSKDAPQRIIDLLRAYPKQITIVALAPLTNLALALELDPEGFCLAKEIVILGGTIHAPGNKGRFSEFNFFVDPDAADAVMGAIVPKTLIPLDVCYGVVLALSDFERIKNTALRELCLAMMRPYVEGNAVEEGIPGAIMYDPLTIHFLLERRGLETVSMDLVVESKGDVTRGMVVPETRLGKPKNYNAQVLQKIECGAFTARFTADLNSGNFK